MYLVNVVFALAVTGLLLWLINRFIPMQSQIKAILNSVVVVVVAIWVLNLFGVFDYITPFRIGR